MVQRVPFNRKSSVLAGYAFRTHLAARGRAHDGNFISPGTMLPRRRKHGPDGTTVGQPNRGDIELHLASLRREEGAPPKISLALLEPARFMQPG